MEGQNKYEHVSATVHRNCLDNSARADPTKQLNFTLIQGYLKRLSGF